MDVSNKKKENAYSHFLRNKAMITYSHTRISNNVEWTVYQNEKQQEKPA